MSELDSLQEEATLDAATQRVMLRDDVIMEEDEDDIDGCKSTIDTIILYIIYYILYYILYHILYIIYYIILCIILYVLQLCELTYV